MKFDANLFSKWVDDTKPLVAKVLGLIGSRSFIYPMYQVNKIIGCDYNIIGKEITFDENYKGDVEIYYYKYPELIAEDEDDDTYTFELDQDALEILP